jgi:hypothetical protein
VKKEKRGRKPTKNKHPKPDNFDLVDKGHNVSFKFQAGHRNQAIIYLKPDPQTYYWIRGAKKLRALKKWLEAAMKHSGMKP